MLKFKLLTFALLLFSVFASAQFTARINLIAATEKLYNVSDKAYNVISAVASPGDTLKLKYNSATEVKPVSVKSSSVFSTTLKKIVTGDGSSQNPYKISLDNFGGFGCPHVHDQSFTVEDIVVSGDTLANVKYANGQSSIAQDANRIKYILEEQRVADSMYEEFMSRGRRNGYQPIGKIKKEVWNNIGGASIANVDWSKKPDTTYLTEDIQVLPKDLPPHATRFTGFVFPPMPGMYTFWLSADDAATLFLSTDSTPANKRVIAYNAEYTQHGEFNKYASQKSVSIYLLSTQKYYIELLHKDGGGGSQIDVMWQLPNGNVEIPISGKRMSPYYNYNLQQ